MITAEKLKSIIPKSTPKQRLEKENKKLKKQFDSMVEKKVIKAQKQGLTQCSLEFNVKMTDSTINLLREHYAKLGYRTAFNPYHYGEYTSMTIYWGETQYE